ncbi:hypothetical protein EVG20_g7043 [Dentipellis fragilis]|uniref:Uncharacterized protein n=1 Tax=Dentipellis fragilis TaxID=205917 RepID=A0A4Y9YJ32_9AGAM|nr:hypothetical protein EVG20_g7043 [Dentipellis fragilis]
MLPRRRGSNPPAYVPIHTPVGAVTRQNFPRRLELSTTGCETCEFANKSRRRPRRPSGTHGTPARTRPGAWTRLLRLASSPPSAPTMHHTAWTSDVLRPARKSSPQPTKQKAKAKGKDKENALPRSPAARRLDALIAALQPDAPPPARGAPACFCQGASHRPTIQSR